MSLSVLHTWGPAIRQSRDRAAGERKAALTASLKAPSLKKQEKASPGHRQVENQPGSKGKQLSLGPLGRSILDLLPLLPSWKQSALLRSHVTRF